MKYAVILAGGSGMRAGGDVPKQFQKLGGLPMLWWSVRAFHNEDSSTRIRIVMHPGFFDLWDILWSELSEDDRKIEYELVCGGRSRLESVKNGISAIPDHTENGKEEEILIAVHDAARPLVDIATIRKGWEMASVRKAAVPVVGMTDSIRLLLPDGSESLDRSRYVRVQTPQVFEAGLLKRAYGRELLPAMTDDASVVESAGMSVSLYDGSEINFKVTNPLDFVIADAIIEAEKEERNKLR